MWYLHTELCLKERESGSIPFPPSRNEVDVSMPNSIWRSKRHATLFRSHGISIRTVDTQYSFLHQWIIGILLLLSETYQQTDTGDMISSYSLSSLTSQSLQRHLWHRHCSSYSAAEALCVFFCEKGEIGNILEITSQRGLGFRDIINVIWENYFRIIIKLNDKWEDLRHANIIRHYFII